MLIFRYEFLITLFRNEILQLNDDQVNLLIYNDMVDVLVSSGGLDVIFDFLPVQYFFLDRGRKLFQAFS